MPSRILFVHNLATRFVQIDMALLREKYKVREWNQRGHAVNIPALSLAVAESDLVFGWFASWHTWFPMLFGRLFNRPSLLVVGGYDTANMPDVGYGNMRGGYKRWVSRTTMKFARHLMVNSCFIRAEVVRNAGIESERITVIPHGEDVTAFAANGGKEHLALTVGDVDRSTLSRKGILDFVRAAKYLPDVPFIVVGAWRDDAIDYLRSVAPPNVKFTGRVADGELRDYLSRGQVYVQASRHEGFGMAVAEAMLSECVPVVTRAGALPEVVGEAGIYVDILEPGAVADAVRRALELDRSWGRRARERIVKEFPLERRRAQLHALVDEKLRYGAAKRYDYRSNPQ